MLDSSSIVALHGCLLEASIQDAPQGYQNARDLEGLIQASETQIRDDPRGTRMHPSLPRVRTRLIDLDLEPIEQTKSYLQGGSNNYSEVGSS